jgi:TrmH family RNA methyltransferase
MALITVIRDLHRRKARDRRGLALAEGVRLVEEMVATGARCKGVVVAPSLDTTPRGAALRASLQAAHLVIVDVGDDDMATLATTEHPQGVIAVYEPRAWQLSDVMPDVRRPLLVLDGVQDPGNVGTIARTALAFGASGLVALAGTADLTNPKAVRSAMGALFRLPHLHADDDAVFGALTAARAAIWAADMRGEPMEAIDPDAWLAIVVGNEGGGLRPEVRTRATRTVSIAMRPGAESLNVAVAAGILLHHVATR